MPYGGDRSALAGDPRFFRRAGPHTLAAVVDAAGVDGEDAEAPPRRLMLHRIAPLGAAIEGDVTFCLNNRKYLPDLAVTRASAVIVHPNMQAKVPEAAVAILAPDPLVAWARVAALFHPLPPVTPGIHPSAVVAASAWVDPTAEVGALAVIGENVTIGPRGRIGAMVGDRRRRADRPRRADRLACLGIPRADRRPCLYLSRRPNRPGRLRLRHHPRRLSHRSPGGPAW